MTSLAGKTAIVTGASSGFGAATARLLAEAGVRVAGGARRIERLETEIALPLDVTDPDSCAAFVVRAARRPRRDRHPDQQRRARARPRPRRTRRPRRTSDAMMETNVLGLMRMTRLCLPHIRDGGHIVNLGSIAGRAAYPNGSGYIASKFAVRGYTYALREDLLGRPIRITTVDPGARRDRVLARPLQGRRREGEVGLRGDRPAHRGRHRRVHPVRAHPPAARQRRRDRGQGARAVERSKVPPQPPDGADDPRRLDVLHLRRPRRPRRDDGRLLRARHALPLATLPARSTARRRCCSRPGRVEYFSAGVLPPQPARRRPGAGRRSRSSASASSATGCRTRSRCGTRGWSPSRSSSRSRSAPTSRTSSSVKEHDFALGDPLHAQPLPALVEPRFDTSGEPVRLPRPGRQRHDAGDPLPAGRGRGRLRPLPDRARPARVVGRPPRRRRLAGRRRDRAAPRRSGASARSAAHVSESLAAWELRVPQLRASWDGAAPLLRPVGRRPRLAADARRRARGDRPAARGRDAVVHDGLRARHADHLAADAAVRAGARTRRARGARRAAGDARTTPSIDAEPGKIVHEVRHGKAAETWFPRYYGSVDATPLYLVLLSEVWRWTDDTPLVRELTRARHARARVDRPLRRPRRRRLRRVRAAHRRAGSRTSRGRTRATRSASPTGASPQHADRAVRGAGLRLRREASDGRARPRGVARLGARRPARARGGRAEAAVRRGVLGRRARRLLRARARRRQAAASTRCARTWATCSGAGSSRTSGSTRSSTG